MAFVAWQALLGLLFMARSSSSAGASASRPRRSAPCRGGQASLIIASGMGLTLNLAMFSAFGLIPIALALMLFYTYPAGVVVVDVAMGHERDDHAARRARPLDARGRARPRRGA